MASREHAPVCAINLSNDTISRDRGFADFVLKCAVQTGARPDSILFEIPTLETVSDFPSLARVIPPLRAAGFRFAISGFTVGMQVESAETLEALRSIEVDFAQGYGIDRPRILA